MFLTKTLADFSSQYLRILYQLQKRLLQNVTQDTNRLAGAMWHRLAGEGCSTGWLGSMTSFYNGIGTKYPFIFSRNHSFDTYSRYIDALTVPCCCLVRYSLWMYLLFSVLHNCILYLYFFICVKTVTGRGEICLEVENSKPFIMKNGQPSLSSCLVKLQAGNCLQNDDVQRNVLNWIQTNKIYFIYLSKNV